MLSRYEKWHRRCQRIARFIERQRAARQWIPLPEIADWCARSVTGASAAAEEQARTLAYQRLDQSSRDGEFERAGCRAGQATTLSEIRYLDPDLLRGRLEREQLAHIESIRGLAEHCWLPRELVRQWLAAHSYSWPTHFDPMASTVPDTAMEPAGVLAHAEAPLHGKALDEALDQWARDRWGEDMTKLPSREQLLSLARAKPKFRKVTQTDIRSLRVKLAPDEIKKGGARLHRRL